MLCKICFTIILCRLHLRRIWHTMCQKNGEAYLTHVKQNMLHMWLFVLHLRQLCHIVCHIWLCAGTDLQCTAQPRALIICYFIATSAKVCGCTVSPRCSWLCRLLIYSIQFLLYRYMISMVLEQKRWKLTRKMHMSTNLVCVEKSHISKTFNDSDSAIQFFQSWITSCIAMLLMS
jgi:hypothetical protein